MMHTNKEAENSKLHNLINKLQNFQISKCIIQRDKRSSTGEDFLAHQSYRTFFLEIRNIKYKNSWTWDSQFLIRRILSLLDLFPSLSHWYTIWWKSVTTILKTIRFSQSNAFACSIICCFDVPFIDFEFLDLLINFQGHRNLPNLFRPRHFF